MKRMESDVQESLAVVSSTQQHLILLALPFVLIALFVWARKVDARNMKSLGKEIRNDFGEDDWVLDIKGEYQKNLPFGNLLPSESLCYLRQAPALINVGDGPNSWVFNNAVLHHNSTSVLGGQVMVAMELPFRLEFGVRIEQRVGGHLGKGPFDSRFVVLSKLDDGRRWWLCATTKSEKASALVNRIFELKVPDEVHCVQIMNNYLLTSCSSKGGKAESYANAWYATSEFYDRVLATLDTEFKDIGLR